ncbi:MAG: DUF447 domain-containing protein [Planctomycetota bacterium]
MVSEGQDGKPHCAPMGPVVDEALRTWLLRPFQSSQTFQNLRRNSRCAFHVTDDVRLIVDLVLGGNPDLEFEWCEDVWILKTACQWYHLKIQKWDTSSPRSEARASLISRGDMRPFWGWNRAKHAVLEATILVTRLHLLDQEFVEQEFERLESPIEKTAGESELDAWSMLRNHLAGYDWSGQ